MPASISIITPVHDPEPAHLRALLESVREQSATAVQHVLVDDGSRDPEVLAILASAAEGGATLVTRAEAGGIVDATNDGLAAATGELIAFVDHDDVIEPDALMAMAAPFDDGDVGVAYSDHDFIRPDGRYADPCFKPDWSPERLRSQNYVTHLVMARRSLIDQVGGVRPGYDGAQDHDLLLRLGEVSPRVAHVPRVLYHWRMAPTSVSGGGGAKPWAFEAGVRAVADHCERRGVAPAAAVGTTDVEGIYRIDRTSTGVEHDHAPPVSVVIPTRGSVGRVWGMTRSFVVEAVRSIVERSTYPNVEFVVVVDDDTPLATLAALRDLGRSQLTLVDYREPFNFSAKMNLGAAAASGDLLLLLNDDTELIEPTSISTMVGLATQPADGPEGAHGRVAMVGAKLLFADGTLQHGGHVYHHDVMHACFGWAGDSTGPTPLRHLAVERETSGVTAAAALVRREVFDAVGGFPVDLPLNYNDVDLCLKIRAGGDRIIWTPHASWYHFESRSRHSVLLDEEYAFINNRWHFQINNDPYYNPNLLPDRSDWMERPFRSGAPAVATRPNAAIRTVERLRRRSDG